MFQKEVADRILAKCNTKQYSRITILANFKLDVIEKFRPIYQAIKQVRRKTRKYIEKSKHKKNYDVFSEDIRLAIKEISKIYGKIDIENILDIIFNDFCIGK